MRWDRLRWDEIGWDEMRWFELRWDGLSWDEMRWDGLSCVEMRWDEMRWNEIGWDEMRWDGMGGNRMARVKRTLPTPSNPLYRVSPQMVRRNFLMLTWRWTAALRPLWRPWEKDIASAQRERQLLTGQQLSFDTQNRHFERRGKSKERGKSEGRNYG